MKEPILEYLQIAEPEIKIINTGESNDDSRVDIKKLVSDRKRTMGEWNSKVKNVTMDKVEKRVD